MQFKSTHCLDEHSGNGGRLRHRFFFLIYQFIMVFVKNISYLSEKYINSNLRPLTLEKKTPIKGYYLSAMSEYIGEKPWAKDDKNYYAFILKKDKQYIGWGLLDLKDLAINIYVKYTFRKKGFAKLIHDSILKFCKKRKIRQIYAFSNRNFYKKLGYTSVTKECFLLTF